MTNYEALTIETMADLMCKLSDDGNVLCDYCAYVIPNCCHDCESGVYAYLNQEDEE